MAAPEYSLQAYWQHRFLASKPFEWLNSGTGSILTPLLSHLDSLKMENPFVLHIGVGSSSLSLALFDAFIERGWSVANIVNLDFAFAAIESAKGLELIHTGSESFTMSYSQANLLDWPSVAQLGPFHAIIDKSTTDSISTGEDVTYESASPNLAPHLFSFLSSAPLPISLSPVHILSLTLSSLSTEDCRWYALSYSDDRWRDVQKLESLKWPWVVIKIEPIATEENLVQRSSASHVVHTPVDTLRTLLLDINDRLLETLLFRTCWICCSKLSAFKELSAATSCHRCQPKTDQLLSPRCRSLIGSFPAATNSYSIVIKDISREGIHFLSFASTTSQADPPGRPLQMRDSSPTPPTPNTSITNITSYTAPITPTNPPKWTKIPNAERRALIAFGSFLSLCAGYINGITLFGSFGTTVSHTTGSSTQIGIRIASGQLSLAGLYTSLVVAFLLGGVVAAAVVGDQGFRWSRRYGIVMMLEAVFLVFAWLDMHTKWDHQSKIGRGSIWAAFACGLQNAITTTFSGAVIRTTHTTGLITDIGVVIGQAIFHWDSGKHHLWKLQVFVPLYFSFVLGGMAAVLGHETIGEKGLLVVAGVYSLLGLVHTAYRAVHDFRRRQVRTERAIRWQEYEEQERERYLDEPDSPPRSP